MRLLQRSTRNFQVSELGQQFYQHCLSMIAEAEAAAAVIEIQRSEPVGTLRISCPSSLIQYQIAGMAARYMRKYPKVTIILESTSRRVDVLREGFDMAIRMRFPPLEDSDLIVRRFETDEQYLVASPGCVQDAHAEGCASPSISRACRACRGTPTTPAIFGIWSVPRGVMPASRSSRGF
ncbi:LysR substrate-binding domain-containing protein [Paracoccus cavernae]|uniref:LysR substrate-binding domain-containing protein n=2 Tax=Paracoccus cavernae TaxID=1571207 RepID=A0ABT8DB17_9RHOB|nr:LysR substrate-binding domain-containing protein [Paracoccus cavernae]